MWSRSLTGGGRTWRFDCIYTKISSFILSSAIRILATHFLLWESVKRNLTFAACRKSESKSLYMVIQILNIVTISFSYFSELQRRQDSNLEETDYVLDIRTSVTYALLRGTFAALVCSTTFWRHLWSTSEHTHGKWNQLFNNINSLPTWAPISPLSPMAPICPFLP